ncbi:MAG: redox-sensing transcriptional repressor Rex, partial [Actinomycetota bacterium]
MRPRRPFTRHNCVLRLPRPVQSRPDDSQDSAAPDRYTIRHMKARIPDATVARLPGYLRCLTDMHTQHGPCSSEDLARAAGVNAAQVRKDLSYLGSQGTRGVGYDHEVLSREIRKVLGLTSSHPVVVIGAGNMGTALANHKGFHTWGFDIVAVLDVDEDRIGTRVDGLIVEPLGNLEKVVESKGITIGILATPPSAAQTVADRLVAAGVKSILNLAPAILRTEDDVSVRRVDLSTELGILAFHLQ